MRRQSRTEAPEFLKSRWEPWGREWEENLGKAKPSNWNWRQVDGQKINHLLLPLLKAQAGDHCSFCDAHPVSPPSNETIEHFRPKSKFPLMAWHWENLYFACDFCQSRKGQQWEDGLLSPDSEAYVFGEFFWADATTGRIEVRPGISEEKERQAECTLRLYGLNEGGHPSSRLAAQERRSALPDWDIDRFPYRDFLEAEE